VLLCLKTETQPASETSYCFTKLDDGRDPPKKTASWLQTCCSLFQIS